jgi:RNA polymerase sigma factor (TIGR02999 family)
MARSSDVTELLSASRSGGGAATERLMQAVYEELRSLAAASRAGRPADETLSTTALVHEAYLKLVDGDRLAFDGRAHFFSAAARAMRQVIVDQARAKHRAKRGSGEQPLRLGPDLDVPGTARSEDLLALDEALSRFEAFDPRAARVVECRYFAGLSLEETADALELSPSTVKREWVAARAWLHRALTMGP